MLVGRNNVRESSVRREKLTTSKKKKSLVMESSDIVSLQFHSSFLSVPLVCVFLYTSALASQLSKFKLCVTFLLLEADGYRWSRMSPGACGCLSLSGQEDNSQCCGVGCDRQQSCAWS